MAANQDPKAAISSFLGHVHWALGTIIDLAVAVVFAAVCLKMFGFVVPSVPVPSETQLAWLMLAYAGYKFKGKLV